MYTTIKFARVRSTAKIPAKRNEDAGYDLYADFKDDYLVIAPHETRMIPTGIASACSRDYCFILKERGSTGTKGLAQRCGVIDSGYRGEIFVPITNTTDHIIAITKYNNIKFLGDTAIYYPYEKAIAQIILVPVPHTTIEEISYKELKNIKSERDCGALGSSGK